MPSRFRRPNQPRPTPGTPAAPFRKNRQPTRRAPAQLTRGPLPESLSLFAVAAPGLERITARELAELGLEGRAVPGGVEFTGRLTDLYRVNLHTRTASRILVRQGRFHASAFWELEAGLARVPWEHFLRPGQPVAVHATSHHSRLFHSDAVAERVATAVGRRLGQPSALTHTNDETEAEGPQLVVVRLVENAVTLSLDSSGALLHQRGYRLATAKAPLRETLAAGILLAAQWAPTRPLLDPFCGAGTLPIEAALLARRLAPGRGRSFAYMHWPAFDATAWQGLLEEADAQALPADTALPPIVGSDRDAGAIAAAVANAERAGVAGDVAFTQRPVSALEPHAAGGAEPGWVVTNPPYGRRVRGGPDLRALYARFGDVLRQQCSGWQVAMLAADPSLAAATGLRFDLGRSVDLVNGGLPVTLMRARVPAGP